MSESAAVLKKFDELKQTIVVNNYKNLTYEKEKHEFIENLKKISDPARLLKDCHKSLKHLEDTKGNKSSDVLEPLPKSSYESIIDKDTKEYFDIGLSSINKGEVAVILLAGGQGTRLGSSSPKGCYDIGLYSHKSLFQIQAEKLISLQNLSKTKIPIHWYIMTSPATRSDTEIFFKENNFFGLLESQITFFNQDTLPAFNITGDQFLVGSPTDLSKSPNGNGGLYKAIRDHGILDDLVKRNIKHLHMYCVDNVLAKLADPVFIGYTIKNNFQLATKVVRKSAPHESVGVIATKNGKPCVIEYSEISKELAESRDPENGLLKFRAANIVNHYYSVALLVRQLNNWCEELPYHVAKKKIKTYDASNKTYTTPKEPNGIKLEQFIFDVFETVPLKDFGCMEVERESEFAPLKNSNEGSNSDNPNTSRLAYLNLGTKRLIYIGAKVEEGILVEVSSKLSYGGENLDGFSGHKFNENGKVLEL